MTPDARDNDRAPDWHSGSIAMKTAIAVILSLAASGALAAPMSGKSASGEVLTGENGMTLYTFAKDAAGVSNCDGDCAAKWPPFMATEEDEEAAKAPFSVIERSDETYQWAVNGMPLYFWVNDKAAGDTTGDGVGGVWSVARP
jgi:predicted lipoprotein with Yx(FWY)xxD motif